MTEETKKQEEKKQEDSPSASSGQEEKKETATPSHEATAGNAVPKQFKDIVEKIENMSVVDLSQLVKVLEEKFGVSAQAMAVSVAAPSATTGEGVEEKEEQTSFNVELTEAGGNKIAVIKVIREFVAIGLKEAKDLVDAAPKVVKVGLSKEDAQTMKEKLEQAGGTVTLK